MDNKTLSFKEKLESQHQFPGHYLFKFVVPAARRQELVNVMPEGKTSFKESSGKSYTSVTVEAFMNSSAEVIAIYEKASKIEGVISL